MMICDKFGILCKKIGFCDNFRSAIFAETTSVELLSAVSGIITGIFIYYDLIDVVSWGKTEDFWAILLIVFGSIQFISIISIRVESANVLRALMALIAGGFWLWLGLRHFDRFSEPADISTIFIGVTNIWAFVYNFLTKGESDGF